MTKKLNNKVAVITGAASGIGRGLAERCIQENMKVVLADRNKTTLLQTQKELDINGETTLAIVTDVSKISDVEVLAQKTLDKFGKIHFLFNNAGIVNSSDITTLVWDTSDSDWRQVMGVNFFGVVYGVQVFVPLMLKQDEFCHIINIASIAGLTSDPIAPIYRTSKHAVVAFSEVLYRQLALKKSKIKVSVFCPGVVKTPLAKSITQTLNTDKSTKVDADLLKVVSSKITEYNATAVSVKQAVDSVFDGIEDEKFYIFTHPDLKKQVEKRMNAIINDEKIR